MLMSWCHLLQHTCHAVWFDNSLDRKIALARLLRDVAQQVICKAFTEVAAAALFMLAVAVGEAVGVSVGRRVVFLHHAMLAALCRPAQA